MAFGFENSSCCESICICGIEVEAHEKDNKFSLTGSHYFSSAIDEPAIFDMAIGVTAVHRAYLH